MGLELIYQWKIWNIWNISMEYLTCTSGISGIYGIYIYMSGRSMEYYANGMYDWFLGTNLGLRKI